MCSKINFEAVKKHVWDLLEKLDPNLYFYHSRDHTFVDVLPAAIELGKQEGISEEEMLLVSTAALYHDVGYLDVYEKNEPFGAKRAREELPSFGYAQQYFF